jgi:hypothetical protein
MVCFRYITVNTLHKANNNNNKNNNNNNNNKSMMMMIIITAIVTMPTSLSLCMSAAAVCSIYEYDQNMALIAGNGR